MTTREIQVQLRKKAIKENLEENSLLTNKELAEKLGMNQCHFGNRYSQYANEIRSEILKG